VGILGCPWTSEDAREQTGREQRRRIVVMMMMMRMMVMERKGAKSDLYNCQRLSQRLEFFLFLLLLLLFCFFLLCTGSDFCSYCRCCSTHRDTHTCCSLLLLLEALLDAQHKAPPPPWKIQHTHPNKKKPSQMCTSLITHDVELQTE
jgi:hypothetical protein